MAEFFKPRNPYFETKRRTIAKALSWRVFATIITAVVVFVATGKVEAAVSIGLADTVIKFFTFFVHERVWMRINYGRSKYIDYQI